MLRSHCLPHHRSLIRSLALAAALAAGASTGIAHDKGHGDRDRHDKGHGDRTVRIMTQNVYEGTNYEELGAATTPLQFVQAVTATFQGIAATLPAERAADIAKEIAEQKPDLIGLQEVSIVRTGTTPPATTVVSDLLQLITSELKKRHQHYKVVAVVTGLDAEAPSTLGFNVRLTAQSAILARVDDDLKLSNAQVHMFTVNLNLPSPVGPVTFRRGWASVDVKLGHRSFRFAATHLDPVVPAIRLAQAGELIAGIGTTLPVILVGDFNANPANTADPTYQNFRNADFDDAWRLRRGHDDGFTCCQAGNLLNPDPTLTERVDWILLRGKFRGDIRVEDIELIGEKRRDRTRSGLWPSDHAGLVAKLRLNGHAGH